MAGTLTVGGLADGLLTGEKVIGPATMTGTTTVGQITDLTLAQGDNTLAVPAGAFAVLIELPANNTVVLRLRSNLNSSDIGTPVGPSGYLVCPLPAGTTSLILNAAATVGAIEATFI